MKKFEDFALSSRTMKFIALNHFTQPTPIQEQVIPAAVSGRDVIGLSRTGTGKSHAFLIPVMERTDSSIDHVQAVITAPTRELAAQLYEKAKLMNKADPSLRIRLYVGGKDREKDLRQLKASQPHIAIGTPGRIRDLFLNEGALRIDQAEMLVIDEADMTLEYGNTGEQTIGNVYVTDVTGCDVVSVDIPYTDLVNTSDSTDTVPLTLYSGGKELKKIGTTVDGGFSTPLYNKDLAGLYQYDVNGYVTVSCSAIVSDWSGATAGATYQAVLTFDFWAR